jgi:hypothetical protein
MNTVFVIFILPAIIALIVGLVMYRLKQGPAAIGFFTAFRKANESDGLGQVIHSRTVNHFMGLEVRAGRLTLTPDALIFQAHGWNVQIKTLTIPLEQCVRAEALAACGKITPGTMIESPEGKIAPAKRAKGLTFMESPVP